MEDIPTVEPIDIPQYKYKNSKYEILPKLPARMIAVASSTGGKSVLLQNLILKIYRGSFERIYICSPSIHVADTWTAVKKYISDVMKVDAEKEHYYEEYDPLALKKIIETQHKVIDFQKKNKQKEFFSVLIVVDGFADDPQFVRYSNILHGLFTRGRHSAISCILSTQKYNVLAPIIRLNSSALFILRLKNMNEVNSVLEENSALVDKKALYDMYQQAENDAPYPFFYINANAKDVNNMFLYDLKNALKLTHVKRFKGQNIRYYRIMPKTPIDYSKTHFYKIVCKDLNIKDCYIGHTTDLTKRKHSHKKACINPNVKYHNINLYKTVRENGGWDGWDMLLISTESFANSLEARRREREITEEIQANVNMVRPFRSKEEADEVGR